MDKKKTGLLIIFCCMIFMAGAGIAADDKTAQSGLNNDKDTSISLGRDPFKRGASLDFSNTDMLKDGISNVQVSGIVYDEKNPAGSYCIINSQLLRLGESVERYVITGIQDNFIIMTSANDNKDYKIKLWDLGKDSS